MNNRVHLSSVMRDNSDRLRLVAFEVTRRCAFNCRYCRASAGYSVGQQELATGQCKRILKSVADFTLAGGRRRSGEKRPRPVIILTGGEPMEREDIYELGSYGSKLGMRMVMATCGYLINDESIARIREAGVSALSFSLDGASAETNDEFKQTSGAFDAIITAAEIAARSEMPFQINTTITKLNVDEIFGIAELAKKLGANCFNAFALVPTGRAEQMRGQILDPIEYESLLNELLRLKLESEIEVRVTCAPAFARLVRQEKLDQLTEGVSGCMAGKGFGFISYRGDVQTCGFLDIVAGNLLENDFDFGKIWTESPFLNEIRAPCNYPGNCGTCAYGGVCGGCRARAFALSGDYLAADPVCGYRPRADR